MENPSELERYEALVGRIFKIEDITVGKSAKEFIVRYRGRLVMEDTEAAYDLLSKQLEPYGVTPLFRWDEDRHAIILVPGKPRPAPSNPWVNLVLFILTLLSVALVGGLGEAQGPIASFGDIIKQLPQILWAGATFAIPLLTILGAHEFGHYLMGRYHGVQLTLPYFIPFPFSPIGTLGAVINMKETPRNRRHLLDIGIAGPLAGLFVAVPILLAGLALSNVDRLPTQATGTSILEGNSILYLLLKFIMFGKLLPAPVSFGGLPAWLYWLRFFFTGQPIPLGGEDVMLHPMAFAGWVGILVTALNLIPAGQLDGGHVMYVLLGRKRALRLLPFILGFVALLGLAWYGWWLWVALLFFFGRVYAEPLDQITPLDGRRRWLAIAAIVIFVLVFVPIPFGGL